jgi:hypothetical protein
MSEIVSMSSGPQGAASSDEAFEGAPSPEFGREESRETSETGSEPTGTEENVPRGTNGEQNGDGLPKSAAQQKQESRYERTKREKAAFRQQQEAFRQQQAQFARERAEFEQSKKPKRDYSLADLKKYRETWRKEAEQGVEGREELVTKADEEIKAMEAEEQASKMVVELPKLGTPEHRQQWQAAERELAQADPDFMKSGTRVDTKLREIFAGPNADAYRNHPQGIYAAYDRAKRELLEEDVKGLRTENTRLTKELQRYTGLTSIGGGVPGRMGDGGVNSTADFAKLSSTDMRKHLLAASKKSKDTTGWL